MLIGYRSFAAYAHAIVGSMRRIFASYFSQGNIAGPVSRNGVTKAVSTSTCLGINNAELHKRELRKGTSYIHELHSSNRKFHTKSTVNHNQKIAIGLYRGEKGCVCLTTQKANLLVLHNLLIVAV